CFEPALRSFRALGAREYEATVLNNMTVALSAGGDYEAASRVAAECLSLRRELGDQWAVAGILDNLGVLQHRRGRSPEARRLLGGELLADLADWAALESLGREQVELASAHHMLYEEAWARWCLARAALALGRRDEGLAEARAALALAAESDLRGAHRRISDGLAERCGDQAPRLWCDAVASLERYLEAFAPDERAAYLERGGVGARLAGWLERARAVK